ncbi:MAG: alanine racemase [Ignavibacteriaceae bacterium]
MRSTYAEINLKYLTDNYLNIRKKTNNIKIMPVVKANAYGHGVEKIVSTLNSLPNKPDYYAVALVDEGIELRKNKVDQPILIFESADEDQISSVVEYNLMPTVYTEHHLRLLKDNVKKDKIKIHIKINTGMNRLGINYEKAFEFIKRISEDKFFILDGIYTHFATSDEKDKSFANLQLKRFNELITELKAYNICCGFIHAANSGAILDMPESYFDIIRPGISLYGYYPSEETTESIVLKPVMSLITKVDSVNRIEAGETVSYGRKFRADRATNIISVSMGYADGYNRNLTNKSKAIINGKFYKQAGTVTMDRIMFDIKDENIKIGDEVILLGEKEDLKFNAWDWAKILNTIPYEITCGISQRVPRLYSN